MKVPGMARADPSPRLTVFTPFYDDTRYIEETIASVLSQSFHDFEYLLINDGPREQADAIEKTFADSRLRIITNSARLGLSGSRESGLREARGELIAFIDSDDVCEPGRFEAQVAFLDSHPDHVAVGTALRFIDEASKTIGSRVYPETDGEIRKRLVRVNCIAQPSVMARRAALIDAGGYTQAFPMAEDYDLWLRVARRGKLHNLPQQFVAYRIHGRSGKFRRLRPALKDTTRLKIHALRHYGYPVTAGAAMSITMHAVLLLLPDRVIFWLFRRFIVSG